MSRQDRLRLPSGSGGLTRYFDDDESKIRISPTHVVIITIVITIIIIILHYIGNSWLGG